MESPHSRLVWVTDMAVLPDAMCCLLSFTEDNLICYDLTTPSFEKQFEVFGLPHCVVRMAYW